MLYFVLQLAGWVVFRVLYRLRVSGYEHLPASGGVVLAANHASFLDPPMIACAVPQRPLSFMAKAELFRVPAFGGLIRALYAVSVVRRGLTRVQLREFASMVRDRGLALAVFPEGTRSPDGTLGPAHRGIGAICRMAGVPVVPVLISGSWQAWPRSRLLPRPFGRIEVRIGAPVQWTDEELNATGDASGALATLIMRRIAELHDTKPAPTGWWKGLRVLMQRASKPGRRENVQAVSQDDGVPGGYRGKSR